MGGGGMARAPTAGNEQGGERRGERQRQGPSIAPGRNKPLRPLSVSVASLPGLLSKEPPNASPRLLTRTPQQP